MSARIHLEAFSLLQEEIWYKMLHITDKRLWEIEGFLVLGGIHQNFLERIHYKEPGEQADSPYQRCCVETLGELW